MNSRAIITLEAAVRAALARLAVADGATIVIALSGGADSVALTHALQRLAHGSHRSRGTLARGTSGAPAWRLHAAHLNHRLRAGEADRDEAFVRALCARLAIELTVEHAQGLRRVAGNLEERARDLRHAFLERVAGRIGACHVALAHHADDQAETVLMRLLRGGGAAGLAAMAPGGPGRIIRPLLGLRRAQILAYLEALGAGYVVDSSNASPAMTRNRVRHELIPALERDYAPRLSVRLAALAGELRALDDFVTAAARRELARRRDDRGRLRLAGFARLDPALANATLRAWLIDRMGDLRTLGRAHIEALCASCVAAVPGRITLVPRGWRMRCEYGTAVLEPRPRADTQPFAIEVDRAGATIVAAAGFVFEARTIALAAGGCPAPFHAMPTRGRITGPMEALFDRAQITAPLVVRNCRPGDRVAPLGMTGTRKVQDVFVDRKLARARRATWPIVTLEDEILWIPGLLRARHATVTPATRELLEVHANLIAGG
ncbi:MAG: tRNA lysidine(34) synthetase TilS [Candidatus Binataceae bacterium]|nr:tRNA lysidine(34) synthetase TilS [Candidatus Binataceae bacterium]